MGESKGKEREGEEEGPRKSREKVRETERKGVWPAHFSDASAAYGFYIKICLRDSVVDHTPCPERKGATLFLPVSLRNDNRFSNCFYHHTLQKICSRRANTYPIIIYTRRYTTL